MLCENCNENEATIHYTEIVNGVKNEHHVCSECAKELDIGYYTDILNNDFPFAKLLTGLLSSNVVEQEQSSPLEHVICPKCGMSYAEFTRVGKFGCAECYHVFGPLFEENMRKIHGNTQHIGKKYTINDSGNCNQKTTLNQEIATLRAKLKEAVLLENFEDAVKYRDQIKELTEGNEADA